MRRLFNAMPVQINFFQQRLPSSVGVDLNGLAMHDGDLLLGGLCGSAGNRFTSRKARKARRGTESKIQCITISMLSARAVTTL